MLKYLTTFKAGLVSIAEQDVKEYANEAITSGTSVLNFLKPQLQEWKEQLESGEIDQDDLELQLER